MLQKNNARYVVEIIIDVEQINQSCKEIESLIIYLHENLNAMETLVIGLNGDWQGNAEKAYSAKFIYIRDEFRKIEEFWEQYVRILQDFVDEYGHYEEELVSRINSV